jgi:hypothetical protein
MTLTEKTQRKVLSSLHAQACRTQYGKEYGIEATDSYEAFSVKIPVVHYSDLEPWIERIKKGEPDQLWPGSTTCFAISAGTTGKGKHLPITDDRIQSDLRFMRCVSRRILHRYPNPALFMGKHVSLSGSVEIRDGLQYGEISGMLACATPKWLRIFQSMCPVKAASLSWQDRFEQLIECSIRQDIRIITGVPSWILVLLHEASRRRSMPIEKIWPNLKLIVTGGVALQGYKQQLNKELGSLSVKYFENYGASEGYFAFGWESDTNLSLQIDNSIFYELIPHRDVQHSDIQHQDSKSDSQYSAIIPLWEAECDVAYNLAVTTNAGLVRYCTNDIITFDSIDPPQIRVIGRANEMTDTFGEALTAIDAKAVFEKCWNRSKPDHLHIIPEWDNDAGLPRHRWLLVYHSDDIVNRIDQQNLEITAELLDNHLTSVNHHYAIRRDTGAMIKPIVSIAGSKEYTSLLKKQPSSQSKAGFFLTTGL